MHIDWTVNIDTIFMIVGIFYGAGRFTATVSVQMRAVKKLADNVERLTNGVNELRMSLGMHPISHD